MFCRREVIPILVVSPAAGDYFAVLGGKVVLVFAELKNRKKACLLFFNFHQEKLNKIDQIGKPIL
jgi:hypothetical protein